MNWDDPAQRLALVERVGPAEYERQLRAHHDTLIVEVVNGRPIRRINTARFGAVFMVDQVNRWSSTLEGARKIAQEGARP